MGRKIAGAVRSASLYIGVALLVLVLLDGAAEGYIAARHRTRTDAGMVELEQRFHSDAEGDQSWVRDYLREANESVAAKWHSYVYWRSRPYHGKYVNIDEAGIRRTWNRTASRTPGQLKVLMLGGSTLWGVGERDNYTTPSFLSKKLTTQLSGGVWVVNLAQLGYVSTQEVILLTLELREGNVPDVVIFLDGVNDSISAWQAGVAGLPQNESNRVAEFNSLKQFAWRHVIRGLGLYKVIEGLVGSYLNPPSTRVARIDGALARATVDVYLGNVELVQTLAQRYGFRAFFFWQPTVYTKSRLSKQEQPWYERLHRKFTQFGTTRPVLEAVHDALRERMRERGLTKIHDLSGVFDEVRDTRYIDEWHVTESGSEEIAEVMAQDLLREVARKDR